jgi:transcriptional regulator with XRE-family HTH domain
MEVKGLRLIRIFHGLKLNELAKKLDISPSYLSEIERGIKKPTLEVIQKYAEIFDTKPSSIMFFCENLDAKNMHKDYATMRNFLFKFLNALDHGSKKIIPHK